MCQIIQLKDTVIISCGSDDHICNEDAAILLLKGGERVEDTLENREKNLENIRGWSVCCSICNSASIDRAAWL